MSSLAAAAIARLCPTLGHRSLLHNRSSWALPAIATRDYAKSAEERLGLEKPKRPLTPFLKFATQMRPALLAKNPGTNVVQAMKLASKHWQQLGADAKSKMTKEYEENMEDYRKMKAKFDASLTDAQRQEIKRVRDDIAAAKEKRKVKAEFKELGRPKKPMSSYLLFCQTEKDTLAKLGFKDFQAKMKAKWSALAPAERSTWETKATALMEQYRKDLLAWEEKMIAEGNIEYIRTRKTPVTDKKPKSKDIK